MIDVSLSVVYSNQVCSRLYLAFLFAKVFLGGQGHFQYPNWMFLRAPRQRVGQGMPSWPLFYFRPAVRPFLFFVFCLFYNL